MDKKNRRSNLRYDPEENALVEITYHDGHKQHKKIGLLRDESYSGCSFVIDRNTSIRIGQILTVKAGVLPPMNSEVRWITLLDDKFVKIGVLFQPVGKK